MNKTFTTKGAALVGISVPVSRLPEGLGAGATSTTKPGFEDALNVDKVPIRNNTHTKQITYAG